MGKLFLARQECGERAPVPTVSRDRYRRQSSQWWETSPPLRSHDDQGAATGMISPSPENAFSNSDGSLHRFTASGLPEHSRLIQLTEHIL